MVNQILSSAKVKYGRNLWQFMITNSSLNEKGIHSSHGESLILDKVMAGLA